MAVGDSMRDDAGASIVRRRRFRDALLIALTFSTGIADALSYLGLGQIFTANMTGNTVFLALAIGGGNVLTALRSGVALLGFAAGAYVAGQRLEPLKDPDPWPAAVTGVLFAELALLAVFAAIWTFSSGAPTAGAAYVLIAVASIGMGMQSSVGRRLAVPGLTSNVLTMALTGLMAELAAIGISGSNARRWAAAIIAMGAGAALGAALFRYERSILPWAIVASLAGICVVASLGAREGLPSSNPA